MGKKVNDYLESYCKIQSRVSGDANNAAVIMNNRFRFASIGDESSASTCHGYINRG